MMVILVILLFISSSMNLALGLVRGMQFFVYGEPDMNGQKRPGKLWLNVVKVNDKQTPDLSK